MSKKAITPYLREQVALHSSCIAQDIIKQCYQAAFGAEHMLSSTSKARSYFWQEYQAAAITDEPLYEPISDSFVRIHLGAWKRTAMNPEWLFAIFCAGAIEEASPVPQATSCIEKEEHFRAYLQEAALLFPQWQCAFDAYLRDGIRPLHHSPVYREAEQPHYRIASVQDARLLPLLQGIADRETRSFETDSDSFIIALDGRAAAGKTTAAARLSTILDAAVIHMDDFFLPPTLRCEARYRTPGGNVHYERFLQEVLPYLKSRDAFEYRRFDCTSMTFCDTVEVANSHYRIVEGTYSMHPAFDRYADLSAFFTVSASEQLSRITARNDPETVEMFRSHWIPMEEAYFTQYHIDRQTDLLLGENA